ncbi:putative transcriptional regulator, AsnC/Lrp family [Aeropyrum pernix]|uniref:Putative transcriptional regulator, AsnC/Lrp family n=1 Tax=Aeropyrum pernix TaxID=56636 RepID=A0A401HC96_AERPX|nr:Lrp/AsnC family transcriptional regulator [Aeropyrum pernix]GBF09969.1 putative transcriptional regulator, AsnC/Lrp family [Aeropyrum pernix]
MSLRSRGIDAIDIEILRILAKDCTTTINKISQAVGVSVPNVRKRIRRLKALGVIRGCKASIDPEVLGALTYLILFQAPGGEDGDTDISAVKSSEIERIFYSSKRGFGAVLARTLDPGGVDEIVRRIEKAGFQVENTIFIDREVGDEPWVPEKPLTKVQAKCSFCQSIIVGRPYTVVLDDGRILVFHNERCAEAYFKLNLDKGRLKG